MCQRSRFKRRIYEANRKLIASIVGVGLIVGVQPAYAQNKPTSRAVQALIKKGFTSCSTDMDDAVKFVHEDDNGYGFSYVWNAENPNQRSASIVTSAKVGDTSMVSMITATPDASGRCSILVTQNLIFTTSCIGLREGTFKEWKFYGELGATTAYDRDGGVVTAFLSPTPGGGCHVMRQQVMFP